MEILGFLDLRTLYVIIHLFGVAIGAGAAFVGDSLFMHFIKKRRISREQLGILKHTSKMVWAGVLLLVVSGIGLFTLAPEIYAASSKFLAKMTIVALLVVNGVLFHTFHLPFIEKNVGKDLGKKSRTLFHKQPVNHFLFLSGVVSIVSWVFALVLGALRSVPFSYWFILAGYFLALAVGAAGAYLMAGKLGFPQEQRTLKRAIPVLGVLALLLGGMAFAAGTPSAADTTPPHLETDGFTAAEVALHNNPEDCWVILDGQVFDVSEVLTNHPVPFNCGTDETERYRGQHGEGIRQELEPWNVGVIDTSRDQNEVKRSEEAFEQNEELAPWTELYVDEGSWNVLDIMTIVERDAGGLLFIDSSTHTLIARIHGIGTQPHTQVFSPDEKFMYIISRDGWLSKIALETLQTEKSVLVGTSSRGTALTDDGKYVAVGNYDPHTVVLLDADTLDVVQTYELEGTLNGEAATSRAGALVEDGQTVIVALKDLNSVWVIDTSLPGFPVTHKYENIGGGQTPLHDGYLTPDGKHFVVASMGSNTVWVLDTETAVPVGEFETGLQPHTGPGATWGDHTFIPSLGEGKITAVNTKTWEVSAYIETGGPGLFVRSFNKDPSYPYVWADTAFGDHSDEIYVIDGASLELVETLIPVSGETSIHPEFTRNGEYVYILIWTGNEIHVLDSHTFETVKVIPATTPAGIYQVGLRLEEPGL